MLKSALLRQGLLLAAQVLLTSGLLLACLSARVMSSTVVAARPPVYLSLTSLVSEERR